jgi:hypothetical protein
MAKTIDTLRFSYGWQVKSNTPANTTPNGNFIISRDGKEYRFATAAARSPWVERNDKLFTWCPIDKVMYHL